MPRKLVGINNPACSRDPSLHKWVAWEGDIPPRYELCYGCGVAREIPRQHEPMPPLAQMTEWKRLAIANGFISKRLQQRVWLVVSGLTREQLEQRDIPAMAYARVLDFLRRLEEARWTGKYDADVLALTREIRRASDG